MNFTRAISIVAVLFGGIVCGTAIIPIYVPPEVAVTPPQHRFGYAADARAVVHNLGDELPALRDVARFKPTPKGSSVKFWDYAKRINGGKHFPTFRQETGDCVSMGAANAINYLQAVQLARNRAQHQFRPAFQPYIYGISRTAEDLGNGRLGRSAGSLGVWAAQGVTKYGVLAADEEGVPEYSGDVANDWGYRGPPRQFIDVATEFRVRSVAKVTTYEEARDAIANGYPVTVASMQGFAGQPRKSSGRLWGTPEGEWAHQMCFIAFDDEARSPDGQSGGLYCLNSWGEAAHGEPLMGEPPGGFWVDVRTVNRMLAQDDSWAYSQFDGFPSQNLDLDFTVFGDAMPAPRRLVDVDAFPSVTEMKTSFAEKSGVGEEFALTSGVFLLMVGAGGGFYASRKDDDCVCGAGEDGDAVDG